MPISAGLGSVIGAGIGAAGDVIGGLIGSSGQQAANRMNYRIAQENRDFQERMSSTAYQRAAADMEAAGLNRILALGKPASSPSGSLAVMQNAKAALGESTARAFNKANMAAELALKRAQTENVWTDTSKKRAEANLTQSQDALSQLQAMMATNTMDLQEIDKILKNLDIPEREAVADMWKKMQSGNFDEGFKGFQAFGPGIANIMRTLAIILRK
jgi:flagellar biosynthesis GTPase FlhF